MTVVVNPAAFSGGRWNADRCFDRQVNLGLKGDLGVVVVPVLVGVRVVTRQTRCRLPDFLTRWAHPTGVERVPDMAAAAGTADPSA